MYDRKINTFDRITTKKNALPLEPLQVDQVSRLAGRVAVGEDTAAGGGSRCRRRRTTGHTAVFDFLLNVAQTSLDVLPDNKMEILKFED